MSKYKLTWRGKEAKKLTEDIVMKAALKCSAHLKGESQREAPVKSGDLRGNCEVSELKKEGATEWYEVGYDLEYSVIQHERLDFNHPKGGKSKFLEDPFNKNKKQYDAFIKNAAKKALAKSK